MPVTSWIAWRMGRSFTATWHMTTDNRFTLCGRKPDGLLSVWRGKKPPQVEKQCLVCRLRESQEMDKH